MLVFLISLFLILCIGVVVAYLYSTAEMPDIPNWDELELDNEQANGNS